MENIENDLPIIDDNNVYNKKIISKPTPQVDIGIEIKHDVINDILASDNESALNMTALNSFLEESRSRDTQYSIIDQMCQDSIPSAILESFAEDTTATNDNKESLWCISDDPNIAKSVQFIIDSLQLNKNIHKYVTSFIKYGDLYLRLYRQSEYEPDPLFDKDKRSNLNEDINIHINNDKKDHFVNYVEMIDNPATVFELTRFGKTAGFIKTKIDLYQKNSSDAIKMLGNNIYQYSFNENDIDIFQPDSYVHASLDDDVNRISEEVEVILDKERLNRNNKKIDKINYKVKSGQSLFYNTFRIWRELSLLENSLILSRLTKSSITRVIQVETGNVAKEEVSQILQSVKQMIEQKTAINPGNNIAEYTNPGPVENNIYMATHDGKGAITTSQIGGDYDPKALTDIEYFKNKWWGSFGIPKQYFGDTDDNTGFNGGTSLTIISSKYAKKIIKIQSAIIQMVTSLINIFLLDRGMASFINKFTIKMQSPITQEDIDRKEASANTVRLVSDIMQLLDIIEDKAAKLKMLKSMLPNVLDNTELINILDEEITKLENEGNLVSAQSKNKNSHSDENFEETGLDLDNALDLGNEEPDIGSQENAQNEEPEESSQLPTPGETGLDLVNNVPEE